MTDELLKPFDAFLYCRVSSDEQMDRGTIANQIEFGQQYARLNRANILGTFTDDGVSGMLPLHLRPGGEKLLEAARKRPGSRVLVYAVDRLGRDVKVVVDAAYELESIGCAVRSMSQPFDTADALGKAILALLAGFAAMEREAILARTRGGSRRKARAGGYLGGKPPFGLEIEGRGRDAQLVPCKRLVPGMEMPLDEFVAYIFQRVAGGTSCVALAEEFNARKLPTPSMLMQQVNTAETWHGAAIVRIIHNTAARGIYTYGKTGRNGVKREASNVIERECPRLVSDALWNKANDRIRQNRRYAGRDTEHQYLLRSLIKCGNCGGAYTGQSQKSEGTTGTPFIRYRCNNRAHGSKCAGRSVSAEIETIIWDDIFQMMQSAEELVRRIQTSQQASDSEADERIRNDIKRLQDAVLKKQAEKERMLGLYRRGRIDDVELDKSLDEIDAEAISLNLEVQRLEAVEQRKKESEQGKDMLIKSIERMHQQMRELGQPEEAYGWTWERRRAIIEQLVKQVTVTTDAKNEVRVHLQYAFEDLAGVATSPRARTGLTSAQGQVSYISTLL